STNGTYVNRRRIAQATIIREEDRVYVGDFVIRIVPVDLDSRDSDEAPPTPTASHDVPEGGTLKPESAESIAFASNSGWEELTGSQELGRTSSVPAAAPSGRSPSSVPRYADSTGDSSNPGQRFSDM